MEKCYCYSYMVQAEAMNTPENKHTYTAPHIIPSAGGEGCNNVFE